MSSESRGVDGSLAISPIGFRVIGISDEPMATKEFSLKCREEDFTVELSETKLTPYSRTS